MNPIVRVILGAVAGILISFVIVACVEMVSIVIFPLPPGTDIRNPESLKAAMAHVPMGAMVLVLVGWGLGNLIGGLVAGRISRMPAMAVIVGAALLTMAILNMLQFPHPRWFWGSAISNYVLTTVIAFWLSRHSPAAAAKA